MYADLTRDTFDETKHFSRVLIQQGRVPLDADLNEQASILLNYQRRLAADLIGPHGGPAESAGFKITVKDGKLTIGPGSYYVNGILVDCDRPTGYFEQPNLRLDSKTDPLPATPYVVALHVWERHKSAAEDESILEPALGGPDTASRAEVVWQVRTYGASDVDPTNADKVTGEQIIAWLTGGAAGTLRARIPEDETDTDPCVLSPESRFRGLENQLYRVEIHTGGVIKSTPAGSEPPPTFKWSRENGSVILAIRSLRGNRAHVDTLGRDDRIGVHEGDYVEVLSDDAVLRHDKPAPIARVELVDRDAMAVELHADTSLPTYEGNDRHPLLRRWDQQQPTRVLTNDPAPNVVDVDLVNGAVPIDGRWIDLEYGIQVQFGDGTYRPGDYWLIPARTVTGDIQWPTEKDSSGKMVPSPRPPRGVQRHYAPLAIVQIGDTVTERRFCFKPIAVVCP